MLKKLLLTLALLIKSVVIQCSITNLQIGKCIEKGNKSCAYSLVHSLFLAGYDVIRRQMIVTSILTICTLA